jgi:hypothetical protein
MNRSFDVTKAFRALAIVALLAACLYSAGAFADIPAPSLDTTHSTK